MRARRPGTTPLIGGVGPLARVPPVVAFVLVIAVFVVAIVVRGMLGAALLGVLAIGVGVLLAGTWPVLSASARVGRVAVLAALVAVAVSMLVAA